MALQYSGGPYRNDQYTGITTRQGLLNSINTTLVAAGWTSQNIFAFSQIVWTGQPSVNDTVTVGGQVYTFKSSVGATANEVLIDVDASTTLQNLFNAINLGTGAGVKYGSATVLNSSTTAADYSASSTTEGRFRLQSKINSTPFGQQNVIAFSESASNITLTFTTNQIAGYIWTTPKTPAGQQVRIYGVDAGENANPPRNNVIRLYIMDESEIYRSSQFTQASAPNDGTIGFRLALGSGSTWRVIAAKYHVYVYADGAGIPTGNSSVFYAAVPYIYSFLSPYVISSISSANPAVVTTSQPHGSSTGNNVQIRGTTGGTGINAIHSVTVLSPTQFTIPVSGAGYTSGGVCAKTTGDRVAMAFFGGCDDGAAFNFPANQITSSGTTFYQCLNGQAFLVGAADNIGVMSCMISAPARFADAASPMKFINDQVVIDEPHICMGYTISGKALWTGQLYDTFLTLESNTLGTSATVDTRTWFNCTNANGGSGSKAEGSVWLVVP
jgi:hypothetical protein